APTNPTGNTEARSLKAQDDDQTHEEVQTTDAGKTREEFYSGPQPYWPTQQTVAVGQHQQRTFLPKQTRVILSGVLAVILIFVAIGSLLLMHGGLVPGSVGPLGHANPVAKQATWTPLPTATPTLVPLPDFSLPQFCNAAGEDAPPPDCVQCPYTFDHTTYSRLQIQEALDAAADQYQLPRPLVYAIA